MPWLGEPRNWCESVARESGIEREGEESLFIVSFQCLWSLVRYSEWHGQCRCR